MILEEGGSTAGSDAVELLEESTAAEVRGAFLFCHHIVWEVQVKVCMSAIHLSIYTKLGLDLVCYTSP